MVVVADTSVLINLCCVGQGKLFQRAIGLLGLLLRAKSAGSLPAVLPFLDALQRDAGFWLTESLRHHVLKIAGEAS